MIGNSLWRNNEGSDCSQGITFRYNRRSRRTACTAMFNPDMLNFHED
jgi:hypothetical protein